MMTPESFMQFQRLSPGGKRFVRFVLAVGTPFVVAYAFAEELLKGFGRAFIDAWLEARINIGEFKSDWRRTAPKKGSHGHSA